MGTGSAVETATAVEIEPDGLRRFFSIDFHKLFGKAFAKSAPAFPQLHTAPTAGSPSEKLETQTQDSGYSRSPQSTREAGVK
jgi:hypothetical protein